MKKILIIGGGFAGLACAGRLSRTGLKLDVTIIEKKQGTDFLPALPDCLGRGISPEFLTFTIAAAAKRQGFAFINDEVISLDLKKKEAATLRNRLSYDYLVIASGSETNFYGNENIKQSAYKLDDTGDAEKIKGILDKGQFGAYIIAGGGYTGIEVATNVRVFLDKVKRDSPVIVIERAPAILGPLPEWMKSYVSANLKKLRVEIFANSSIDKIEGQKVFVSGGRVFDNAAVIWAAGVKTSGFIQALTLEKNPQGRLKADEYLQAHDSCFVAGDAGYFSCQGGFLRMAVQFAITQGRCAAVNIIRSINGQPLKKYRPFDFGYIIPMANNRSCGKILGLSMRGVMPIALHFFMCVYRSYSLRNKLGLIRGLMRGGRL